MYICARMCMCVSVYVNVCMYMCVGERAYCMRMHTYAYVYAHMCVSKCVNVFVCMCVGAERKRYCVYVYVCRYV